MNISIDEQNGSRIAIVSGEGVLLKDTAGALDIIGCVWDNACTGVVVSAANIAADFFDLKTGLAGEILQKFTNYTVKIALYGDFTAIKSKSLRDFMYESNQGSQVFFAKSETEALSMLREKV